MPKVKFITEDNCDIEEGYVAVKRVCFTQFMEQPEKLRELITDYCVKEGKPLVIENMNKNKHWDSHLFSMEQLEANASDIELPVITLPHRQTNGVKLKDFLHDLRVRNKTLEEKPTLGKRKSKPVRTCVKKSRTAQRQCESTDIDASTLDEKPSPTNGSNHSKPMELVDNQLRLDFNTQKIYAKDVTCPAIYKEQLNKVIPSFLSPLGSDDLFAYTPQQLKAENLMCYIGQDLTGTPIHRDICGTMGHNVMIDSADDSCFSEWFIIEHKYRQQLAEILHPPLPEMKKTQQKAPKKTGKNAGLFLESDRAWLAFYLTKNTNIKVHIVTQRPGDFVIIPSRAYHQVRNNGITIKVAWNRTTAMSLCNSFEEQLPLYKWINRPEVYKCKAIVYTTIQTWYQQLRDGQSVKMNVENPDYFINTLQKLLDVFIEHVIYPEYIEAIELEGVDDQNIEVDDDTPFEIVCDFCHSDVFSKYYRCNTCDEYDLCLDCYAKGRSCRHPLNMQMIQNKEITVNGCIELYQNIIKVVDKQYGLEDKWDQYLSNQVNDKNYSLATICRRIENFRNKRKGKSNSFSCSKCNKTHTIEKLSRYGYQLESIFKQRREENDLDETIPFFCEKCMLSCPERQKIKLDTRFNDMDLVYYLLPSHDKRNWGSAIDYGVPKACQRPKGSRRA